MERDDAIMMATPERWPLGHVLPLKRRVADEPGWNLGLLHIADVVAKVRGIRNDLRIFRVPVSAYRGGGILDLLDYPSITYPDPESAVADGWIVD